MFLMPDPADRVDLVIEQWRRELPHLDPTAKAVTGRLVRAGDLIRGRIADTVAPLGLRAGDFGLLSALRRAGDPFELSPTALRQSLVITSGGLTLQVERLERDGLVQRRPNPDDGRGTLVGLTPTGRDVVEQAVAMHADLEHALISGLTTRETETLANLLRKLLLQLEPGTAPPG
jgi:DNA-binding MarR family transcriptional regulator